MGLGIILINVQKGFMMVSKVPSCFSVLCITRVDTIAECTMFRLSMEEIKWKREEQILCEECESFGESKFEN
jgi:hypothetical protein